EEKQERLFDAFTQGDSTMSRNFGGTGLGLSIVRGIIEGMNGSIGFKSKSGKGSHFWFSLDVEKAAVVPEEMDRIEQERMAARDDIARDLKDRSLRILVVEDVPLNVLVLKATLEAAMPSSTVETAANGLEALKIFPVFQPDVIFMDVQMPELNGIEATKRIRSMNKGTDVPIIALTAGVTEEDRRHCLEAGMDAFLAKPISPENILESLADLLKIQR
ncbi:MAG TPA: histidine kinase, partial [Leptospiraceae bacterium]|nr:histidine kinase [Leptospiraceae bacterium]